jgi:hypothetical protein
VEVGGRFEVAADKGDFGRNEMKSVPQGLKRLRKNAGLEKKAALSG